MFLVYVYLYDYASGTLKYGILDILRAFGMDNLYLASDWVLKYHVLANSFNRSFSLHDD